MNNLIFFFKTFLSINWTIVIIWFNGFIAILLIFTGKNKILVFVIFTGRNDISNKNKNIAYIFTGRI